MSAPAALRARLDEGLDRLGGATAALDVDARERLVAFVELLARWNRVHNLTAVRDPREMIGRHLLDSLSLLPWIGAPGPSEPATAGFGRLALGAPEARARGGRLDGARAGTLARAGSVPADRAPVEADYDLLDIGSGGGLPVLPLAVARPELRFLSVESNGKKARFQRQAVIELGLGHVEVRGVRIETVASRAATVVSRAFAAPDDFLASAARHAVPGGAALVMLGRDRRLPEPLPAPFELEALHALEVPFESGARHLAVCRVR